MISVLQFITPYTLFINKYVIVNPRMGNLNENSIEGPVIVETVRVLPKIGQFFNFLMRFLGISFLSSIGEIMLKTKIKSAKVAERIFE